MHIKHTCTKRRPRQIWQKMKTWRIIIIKILISMKMEPRYLPNLGGWALEISRNQGLISTKHTQKLTSNILLVSRVNQHLTRDLHEARQIKLIIRCHFKIFRVDFVFKWENTLIIIKNRKYKKKLWPSKWWIRGSRTYTIFMTKKVRNHLTLTLGI